MHPVLRILLVGTLVVLLAIVAIVALNWSRIVRIVDDVSTVMEGTQHVQALQDAEGVLAFLAEHRESISLVVLPPDGTTSLVSVNPDVPRPLASTIKILVLAEYARRVDEGALDPDERVRIDAIEAFHLPGTDGGAREAIETLWESEGLVDEDDRVALDDVVRSMIHQSGNAATDYLLWRFGREAIDTLPATLGLERSDAPCPISGSLLAWVLSDEPPEDPDALCNAAWQMAERLAGDASFREAHREGALDGISLSEQARFSATTRAGTAAEYAGLTTRIARGELISEAASQRMAEILSWPMANAPIRREFDAFGTKGGSLPGVLTSASFATPKGEESAVGLALFMEDVPIGAWLHFVSSFVHQDFERRLLVDADFRERAEQALTSTP
jgi:hypothetical protein